MDVPDFLSTTSSTGGDFSPGTLVVLGLGVFGGMAGAWFFQKIRFPQVVGYIFIGLLLGDTCLGLVHPSDVENLRLLNLFALGIIGFLVGGELKVETFRKYAGGLACILFGEGLASFLAVGALTYLIVHLVTGQVAPSLAAAAVFGAISSATDPASTIDVIWEYRAKGVMTAAIIAIVALDDALALTLYGVGTSSAQLLTSNAGSVGAALGAVAIQLFGALALGAVFALALIGFLRYQQKGDRATALSVGVILLVIGMASYYQLDVILAAMTVGFLLVNLAPRRSGEIFRLLRSFAIPIYVLFFVFVGARLNIRTMPVWLWGIAAAYVAGRSLGKWGGAWLGSAAAKSADCVRKYLGMGIFAQGGVAIGLSIVAAENLKGVRITDTLNLGDMIVYVVTATTLVLQFAGPPMVKLAIKLSGEAGRDVTEADVMAAMTVEHAMTPTPEMLSENMSLAAAFEVFREHDLSVYPVVDGGSRVVGILTFDALRNVAGDYENWAWMLVADAMLPVNGYTTPHENLSKVYANMQLDEYEQLLVVDSAAAMHALGVLDMRGIRRKVQNAMLLKTSEIEQRGAVT